MRCAKCGGEVKPTDTHCPHCSVVSSKVEVIEPETPREDTYVHIDEGPGYYHYESKGPGHRVYVKQVNVGAMSLWTKLGIFLILGLIFIVALPLAIFLSVVFSIFWFFIRKR